MNTISKGKIECTHNSSYCSHNFDFKSLTIVNSIVNKFPAKTFWRPGRLFTSPPPPKKIKNSAPHICGRTYNIIIVDARPPLWPYIICIYIYTRRRDSPRSCPSVRCIRTARKYVSCSNRVRGGYPTAACRQIFYQVGRQRQITRLRCLLLYLRYFSRETKRGKNNHKIIHLCTYYIHKKTNI